MIQEKFEEIIKSLPEDVQAAYRSAPAAAKHHQNYIGGLYEHSLKLAEILFNRTTEGGATHHIIDLSVDECAKIGALHDLCKINLYTMNVDGTYSTDKNLYPHHGTLSVKMCKDFGIKLSQVEKICILLHMAGAWWNKEDTDALSIKDRKWISKHFDIIAAVQWADMKACEEGGEKNEG